MFCILFRLIVFPRYFHRAWRIAFFFSQLCDTVWQYCGLFIYSSFDGHLGISSHLLMHAHSPAISNGVYVTLLHAGLNRAEKKKKFSGVKLLSKNENAFIILIGIANKLPKVLWTILQSCQQRVKMLNFAIYYRTRWVKFLN